MVPFWGGLYCQSFTRPKLDIDADNFTAELSTTRLNVGSTDSISISINSDSTQAYKVTANVINKATGLPLADFTATTETLVNGDATIQITPPIDGWQIGEYEFELVFTNAIGNISVSDTLKIEPIFTAKRPASIEVEIDTTTINFGESIKFSINVKNPELQLQFVNPVNTSLPGGTVSIMSGETVLASETLEDGSAEINYIFNTAGNKTIKVVYSGNDVFFDYISEDIELTINKSNQTCFAFGDVPTSKTFGDDKFTVTATGGAETGTISYSSSNTAVLTVDATTGEVTVVGAGSAKIIATKTADDNYNEATIESTEITINKTIVADKNDKVIIEGEEGTSFDPDVILQVVDITNDITSENKDLYNANIKLLNPDGSISTLFDLKLLLNDQPIQPDGPIVVKIKLTDEQMQFASLQVVYINDNGETQLIDSEVIDGYIVFTLEHLSMYAIVGTPVSVPDTGYVLIPVFVIAFFSMLGFAIFCFKRKNVRVN